MTSPVSDTTPPELKSKIPLTTANPTDVVQVTFSEPLNCSTVTSSSFQVRNSSAAVVGTLNCSGSTVTFTPREGFVFTMSYTVSLTSSIKDPAGNSLKGAPQSWTFAGREGKWDSASVVLDSTAAGTGPEVAVSLNGDAMVVWSRANGIADNAWSCRYTQSAEKWSGAVPIFTSSPSTGTAIANGWPEAVKADGVGNFLALWQDTSQALFTNSWATGTSSWGSAVKIRDYASLTSRPAFAVNASGAAVVAWVDTMPGETAKTLMGAHVRGASTSWNWFIEISDGDVSNPSVDIDAAGNAIAVWTRSETDSVSVWASRFVVTTSTPAWTTPIRLNQSNASSAKVAMHRSGRALAVWEENESASSQKSTIRAKWFR